VTRATPGDFERLCADIEREAHEEGPEAVRELEQFREEYIAHSEALADAFSQAQRAVAGGDIAGLAAVASRASRRRARAAVGRRGSP
jgi:hypothetical protein